MGWERRWREQLFCAAELADRPRRARRHDAADAGVACAADPDTGAYVFLQGTAQQIGGTSWAAPTWAAFCALINEARTKAGLGPIGLLNPKIYPLVGTGNLRDITSGNNGKYSAKTGYDMVTGLGTPMMSSLLPSLTSGGSSTPA